MTPTQTLAVSPENEQRFLQSLLDGNFAAVEQEIYTLARAQAAQYLGTLMDRVALSPEGKALVARLTTTHQYRTVYRTPITVTLAGGQPVTIRSPYGLAPHKKRGPKKSGRNGTGTHILLGYWGFMQKRSPGALNEIVRCGVGSASYQLAAEQLASQGIPAHDMLVNRLVMQVGEVAIAHRQTNHFALEPNETLAGKRIGIAVDGGRIRSRENKTGRKKKDSPLHGYDTDWREPKVLIILELDKNGKKQKGTKPLYEATMGGKDKLYALLKSLCIQLNLKDATEIVLLGDGAAWLWDVFASLQKDLRIKAKTTEVVDFFHACEHITELTEAHSKKTDKQRKAWYHTLKALLKTGKHRQFCTEVKREAKQYDLPALAKQLDYFITHKGRMHYDRYERQKLPIGSGMIESAVRRVVNGRLKAPGSFWKIENVERMLTARCALLAGRWNSFVNNFIQSVSLGVGVE